MAVTNQLLMRRYRLTEEASAWQTALAQRTGWREATVSRLALARSLHVEGAPLRVEGPRRGKEHRGEALFRYHEDPGFLPWAVAVTVEHLGRPVADEDELHDLIIAHLHRGLALLDGDYHQAGNVGEFTLSLARMAAEQMGEGEPVRASTQAPTGGAVPAVRVLIGRRLAAAGELIYATLNDARQYSNAHVAIAGMSGSGKTQMAKHLTAAALRAAGPGTGLLFLDYAKGDVADDREYVHAVGAQVFRVPRDVLPVSPFVLSEYSEKLVALAAEAKREIYKELFGLGPKQEGRLFDAIRTAYSLVPERAPAPDFHLVREALQGRDDEENVPTDKLTELLRRLTTHQLFWSVGDEAPPVAALWQRRWIVDLHGASGLERLVAFTLIEQLHREMVALPEAEIDPATGLRQVRCILALDEAHNYLAVKSSKLADLIRVARSKGFLVMLMTQSPDDFDQEVFDYAEQMQFTFVLASKSQPRGVARLLGVESREAKRIAGELGRLEPLTSIGRGIGVGELEPFRIAAFFERAWAEG
jgi:DNA sulfur modification protein DndE